MKKGVETRLDGETLVMRIPMRFQRRGGRKRIVAPDGSEMAPATKPRTDGTLLKALARAHRWQAMLEEGGSTRSPIWQTLKESAAPTSAASCGSRCSPPTSSSAFWTGGRRQGSRSSSSCFRSSGRGSASGSFEGSRDDPRRGYDGMRWRRFCQPIRPIMR